MKKHNYLRTILTFFVALLIFITFFRILFVIQISGSSMEPTLSDKDYVVAFPILSELQRGDVIVTTSDISYGSSIVKRVIALGGDTVNIDFSTGSVYVNDTLLEESYIAEPTSQYGDVLFPITVPNDCVFLLGDNRNHSIDSRYSSIGCIPTDQISRKLLTNLHF